MRGGDGWRAPPGPGRCRARAASGAAWPQRDIGARGCRSSARTAARPDPQRTDYDRLRRRTARVFAGLSALVQRAEPDLVAREIRADDPGRRGLLDGPEYPG